MTKIAGDGNWGLSLAFWLSQGLGRGGVTGMRSPAQGRSVPLMDPLPASYETDDIVALK